VASAFECDKLSQEKTLQTVGALKTRPLHQIAFGMSSATRLDVNITNVNQIAQNLPTNVLDATSLNRKLSHLLARVSVVEWLLLIQLACSITFLTVRHTDSLDYGIACVGILASAVGIYEGVRLWRQRHRGRGANCATVSVVSSCFWVAQLLLVGNITKLFSLTQ
jgi:hypothetical protein